MFARRGASCVARPPMPIASDEANKFNRCEYLRVVPATSTEHERLYGMRQDTESLTPNSTAPSTGNACRVGSPQTKPSSCSGPRSSMQCCQLWQHWFCRPRSTPWR
jgi:hypothetical protein